MYLFRLTVWTFTVSLVLAATAQGATRTVCASGCMYTNLQPAVDAAQPGDTILLRAGETFVGHVTLRRKSGTGVILIRSDAPDGDLPAAGVRLVPLGRTGGNTALSKLARLRGLGGTYKSTPVIRTENGAHHYRLQFLEIDGTAQEGYETLIALGNNSSQTTTSLVPYALTLDRLYVHGHPTRGQKRCLALDSASTEILNSFIAECKHFGSDSQAIAGFNGPGPFRIENNYLHGATENILFGGADPKIPNLVPSDIQIRRNHIVKSLSWRNPILAAPSSPRVSLSSASGVLGARTHYFKIVALLDSGGGVAYSAPSAQVSIAVPSGTTSATLSWSAVSGATRYRIYRGTSSGGQNVYLQTTTTSTTFVYTGRSEAAGTLRTSGTLWNVKNLIELKNAQRVTIEGNLIENVWKASQTGFALVLTPRNANNTAPWTVVQDITIRYNTVQHANGGVNVLGYDYSNSGGTLRTRRINIRHNIFKDIGGSWGGGAQFVMLTSGPSEVVIDHNTIFHTGHVVYVDSGQSSGFVYTNNLSKHNEYGIFGSAAGTGLRALAAYFPSGIIRRNVLAGGTASLYPPDNFFPSVDTFYAQFVNYSAGNYALTSSSPYVGRATDGRNIGVDLTALTAAQAPGGGDTTTNAAPTASPGGPYSGRPGTAVAFSGTGSRDADGSIASYRWEWGDGTSAGSGATPSHTYASAGTYTVRLTVTDNAGATGTATTTASIQSQTTSSAGDIVLTAADVTVIRGNWARISSTSGAGGQLMSSTNRSFTQYNVPLAAPTNYFEAPFMAAANTDYRVWLRLRAPSGSKYDDSVWVQFTGAVTGSGAPLWRTGSTSARLINLEACDGCGVSGWGWQDGAHWLSTATVRFAAAGPQTIRIQPREDGVQIDQIVLSPVRYFSAAPGAATNDGTVLARTAATLAARDVVLRADDSIIRRGHWSLESDSSGADGRRLGSANQGWSTLTALASPANYVEVTFTAVRNVPYRAWLRLSAASNSTANDSVWIQYDGSVNASGSAVTRIGTASAVLSDLEACSGCGVAGWGWIAAAWWTGQTGTVTFQTTGTQRLRIQTRQDGVRIDQIVISPSRYLSSAPGAVTNDRTIVRPDGTISTY